MELIADLLLLISHVVCLPCGTVGTGTCYQLLPRRCPHQTQRQTHINANYGATTREWWGERVARRRDIWDTVGANIDTHSKRDLNAAAGGQIFG